MRMMEIRVSSWGAALESLGHRDEGFYRSCGLERQTTVDIGR